MHRGRTRRRRWKGGESEYLLVVHVQFLYLHFWQIPHRCNRLFCSLFLGTKVVGLSFQELLINETVSVLLSSALPVSSNMVLFHLLPSSNLFLPACLLIRSRCPPSTLTPSSRSFGVSCPLPSYLLPLLHIFFVSPPLSAAHSSSNPFLF